MGLENKNISIMICRVLGMFLIVGCHIATTLGNSAIGQILQVGVQIFLLISGFLYGKRSISNNKNWVKRRFFKINIPCYIWILLMIIVSFFLQLEFSPWIILLDVFNLEGYHTIISFIPYITPVPGTAHLWFITALSISYLLMLILKRNEKDRFYKKIWLLCLFILSIILGFLGIRIDFIFIFFVGYYASKFEIRINKKIYLITTIICVVTIILRLLCKKYCDIYGDNSLYLYVVIPIAYNALALWIFATVSLFCKKIQVVKNITKNKALDILMWLDGISFYVYITHYCFIDGPLLTLTFSSSFIINIIITILAVLLSSIGLKILSDKILKIVISGQRK